ncbi:MAG: hypothetical protein GF416_06375 [Candidatus Altiarchaeales archaeon]|nr:hypothetical protein [Candidatus Altiarchaeales archaeon]MBD3416740.1 hypothetical protein [Candidatus Altiarchaeales archaeon]
MADRMWTYPELRFVFVNQLKYTPQELALHVNREFHDGDDVRSAVDIENIKRGRNIFNKDQGF